MVTVEGAWPPLFKYRVVVQCHQCKGETVSYIFGGSFYSEPDRCGCGAEPDYVKVLFGHKEKQKGD